MMNTMDMRLARRTPQERMFTKLAALSEFISELSGSKYEMTNEH